ncbi:MAG: ribonuclease E/G [Lachnospiraceae bacterium]|nr:ribonuclease E/G [Lachnospiraceae bacterium]
MSDNRYVLTKYRGGVLAFSINMLNNRLETVCFYKGDEVNAANIGDIYTAKVTHVAKGMNAAFISYGKERRGYLPLDTRFEPVLINRKYDGRIKEGDEVLVRLDKEAVRTKEPVFSFQLSLTGKYCVVTNEKKGRGVSKKCPLDMREKLKAAIPGDIEYSVVVRTNAAALKDTDILTDECVRLSGRLTTILNDGVHRTCGSLVWRAPSAYLLPLRDNHSFTYDRIVTDDEGLFEELSEFLPAYAPDLLEKLSMYQDASYPLEKLYSVDTKINELLGRRVWLKSGAYLIIDKTEAMYVADINSGKNISKKENSQYIYEINLEAAAELMRQIRLRNLTGIIVADFINMEDSRHKEQLMNELKRLAREDSVPTTVVDMTALDLVEITRKKTLKSLQEQFE